MTFSNDILLALFLSVLANATNTELCNNTNFILLLLLALAGNQRDFDRGCGGCGGTRPIRPFDR